MPRNNVSGGLTADPRGPFHGPLAHAYACAVHIAVNGGVAWNSTERGCACCSAEQKRAGLQEDWGIETAEDWRAEQEELLDDEGSNPVASMLLGLRRQLAQQNGGLPDARAWRAAISRWCEHNRRGQEFYQRLIGMAGLILDYEKRFVADGLLPPGGFVTDIKAWDFGRGANMARWGVQCGFTDAQTAHYYAVRASEQSRRYHASWGDFSAGYILGRCLHFDKGAFGWRYTDPLAVHHTMMSDPQSPWLNMPWHI